MSSYPARENDVILLLGAGASVDAGIPHSTRMIELLESSIRGTELEPLYNLIKSSIYYSEGSKGGMERVLFTT